MTQISSKPPIIRVGDRVKVINNKFIKRIGYPLIWTDIADEVRDDPRTLEAYYVLVGIPKASLAKAALFSSKLSDDIPFDLVRAVARMRVEEMAFGGNERQIHYKITCPKKSGLWWNTEDEVADYTGQILEVTSKRLAKTGTRFPSASGRSSYDDEAWYEPGGLEHCKTHIILGTDAGEIESINVELVSKVKRKAS
jgi:hypothetical protein